MIRWLMIVTLAILVYGLWPREGHPATLDPPRDWGYHAGAMAVCTVAGSWVLSHYPDQLAGKYPRLTAALSCLAVGALKELAWDNRPDWRDMAANGAGVGLGLVLTIPFDF